MIPASVGWLGRGRPIAVLTRERGRALAALAWERGRPVTMLVCVALAPAVGACGSQAPTALDSPDALTLQRAIAAVRTSAGRGDRAAALAGLDGLRARIERLAAAGKLPRGEATALRAGVARALAAGRRELQPPAPVETSSGPAASIPAPPAHQKDEKKPGAHKDLGHGDGKHGDGKGNGD
jgi:hypothetical protein